MFLSNLETWLMNTVPGIVILGGIGSTLAVIMWKLIAVFVFRVVPLPALMHKKKMSKQAYTLGFCHGAILKEETSQRLVSFIAYHFICVIFALFTITFSTIVFVGVIFVQSKIAINATLLLSVVGSFISGYWGYLHLQYIYRTYLHHWKGILKKAESGYKQYLINGDKKPEPVSKNVAP